MQHLRDLVSSTPGNGLLLVLTCTLLLGGCARWKTLEAPDDLEESTDVAVVLTDNSTVWMEDSYVSADTLFGRVTRPTTATPHGSIAIPIDDVRTIRSKSTDIPRAILGVGLLAVFAAALIEFMVVGSDLSGLKIGGY